MKNKSLSVIVMLSVIGVLISCGCTNVKETRAPATTEKSEPATTQGNVPETNAATTTTLAPLEPQAGGYSGYMEPKAGQWTEYDLQTEKGSMRQKITYLGIETIEGVPATGYEVQTTVQGIEPSIAQLWIDEAMKVVKYATMEQGNVICKEAPGNLQGVYAIGAGGTPKEFDPASKPATETYITPTGKSVETAKYSSQDAETLVSSNVPFGLVKAVNTESGIVVLSLYDYATSGGKRSISAEELLNCRRMEDVFKQPDDLSG
jgi:hypothetical protein